MMKTPEVASSSINRRHVVAASLGGLGLAALDRAEATAQDRVARRGPDRRQGPASDHEAGNLAGQAALAVPEGPHQCRDRRPGRADRRGAGGDRRDRGQGDRALPGRQRPAPGGSSLAGDLPPRLLSRRPDPHQRLERHRHGLVGHQGQGAGRAGLRAARRPDAATGARLRSCA